MISSCPRFTIVAACCAGLLISQGFAQLPPELDIQRDPSGLKIAWDPSEGFGFVLQGSNDMRSWEPVNLAVVREDGFHRVFVPADVASKFYRLVNDGMLIHPAYVGSDSCRTCHAQIYDAFIKTGHPYKLNKADGGPPTYPFAPEPVPPEGYTWEDISYVIGGATYKTRFVDNDGWIITGEQVQFNLETERWVSYHTENPPGTKPYNCGTCHTTGWVSIDDGSVHQDGMPGMFGSFAATGIQCEACHGPGSRHLTTLNRADIVKDTSSALCGQCHIRGAADTIPAKGGFIRHHEQYNELLSAGHKNLSCNTCHDPHSSTKHGITTGIVRDCTDCHGDRYSNHSHRQIADCISCHLPKASKTAETKNRYTADIQTHIFKINTDADGAMFTEDGAFALGATGVTLDYVCYSCHRDPDGVGGGRSTKTLHQLAEEADGFHDR